MARADALRITPNAESVLIDTTFEIATTVPGAVINSHESRNLRS